MLQGEHMHAVLWICVVKTHSGMLGQRCESRVLRNMDPIIIRERDCFTAIDIRCHNRVTFYSPITLPYYYYY